MVSKWNSDLGGVINHRLINLYQKFNPEPEAKEDQEDDVAEAVPTRSQVMEEKRIEKLKQARLEKERI